MNTLAKQAMDAHGGLESSPIVEGKQVGAKWKVTHHGHGKELPPDTHRSCKL